VLADSQAAGQALRAAAMRTAVRLRNLRDPLAIVPGLTWNVAETAADLVIALESYRELVLDTVNAKPMSVLAPDDEMPTQLAVAFERLLTGP
jgi:hypothetical protein